MLVDTLKRNLDEMVEIKERRWWRPEDARFKGGERVRISGYLNIPASTIGTVAWPPPPRAATDRCWLGSRGEHAFDGVRAWSPASRDIAKRSEFVRSKGGILRLSTNNQLPQMRREHAAISLCNVATARE